MECRSRSIGFTLIELLLVISLSAVILALAVPSMSNFIRNSRVRATSFDIHSTLAVARSEALRQRGRVVLCPSNNATTSSPTCAGATRVWDTGWLVFASADNSFDPAADLLLRVGPEIAQDYQLRTNSAVVGAFAFASDGTLDASTSTVRFAVCDHRGGAHGIQLNVYALGNNTSHKGTTSQPVNCNDPA
jgi:type IV fimbrial biogenesis protein FimT